MRKLIALLLALVMCFALCACGGGTSTDNSVPIETDTDTVEDVITIEEAPETPETTEYEIGEPFGTDNIECVISGLRWITPEEFDSVSKRTISISMDGENVYSIDTDALFPECVNAFGSLGSLKSEVADKYFLLLTFTLQNIGKEIVEPNVEWQGFGGLVIPYGTFKVIYDDGYIFDIGESGFTSTLAVLGDAVKTVGGCIVPKQVYENEDKPLKVMVILPNAEGESEEFLVSIR